MNGDSFEPWAMTIWKCVLHGDWQYGYEDWPGKPKYRFVRDYYDGYYIALHIGKFYLTVCHEH